ncbi:MAG: helix-turn-helix domain-containing protein [Phycisphaerales bacterium]
MPRRTHDDDRKPFAPLAVGREEAARLLGISERLLWTWTNAGEIPHVRLGARVLYPVDELRRWLENQTRGSAR